MKNLMVIDGNSILNRAFFALPPLTNAKGLQTNAILGFMTMLLNVVYDRQPDGLLVTFDMPGKNFRHEKFGDYKGTRKGMPDELAEQLEPLRNLLTAMGISIWRRSGYEADDLIGTIVKEAMKEGIHVDVVSGDKDLLQLADELVSVGITKHGTKDVLWHDPETVFEEMGIWPDQVVDYKGLRGDTSDNIPGVRGVGDKGAVKMLSDHRHLEDVYLNLEELTPRNQKLLTEQRDMAFLSRDLATIFCEVEMEEDLESYRFNGFEAESARSELEELELSRLMSLLGMTPQRSEQLTIVPTDVESDDNLYFYKDGSYHVLVGDDVQEMELVELLNLAGKKPLVGFDLQPFFMDLKDHGLSYPLHFDDVMIEHYLLYPDAQSEDPQKVVGFLPEEKLAYLKALRAHHHEFQRLLKEKGLTALYEGIERPLIPILADIQHVGFNVDESVLDQLDLEISQKLRHQMERIYELAGEEFNINSPKQLAVILFEKLELPVIKKTKTGYSTNHDVLMKLYDKHPIIEEILSYRVVSKLQSTYIDGLKKVIKDGRIHTQLNQTIAVTGRLSSKNPNLQNIPIRLEEGRRIRKIFVPSPGRIILTADYSQIELRVLAHISGDKNLTEAYNQGKDIHQMTASKVFDIPFEEVSSSQRREAKAVNFGIVYGISDYGLSENIDISRSDAKQYIEKYFEEYPGIKRFMDQSVEDAKEKGYVKTLSGRIREIPDIHAKNFNVREFAKRTAMNSPIQGTAADIIKISMIHVVKAMEEQGLQSDLILQVHDELIFDVPLEELEIMKSLVKKHMEEAYDLDVPLEVNIEVGESWYDTK